MFRLMEVLLCTTDMKRMRAFYERAIGLRPGSVGENWTSFKTGGALLALRSVAAGSGARAELTFATDDLEAALRVLQERGAPGLGPIQAHEWGRVARFLDPEGNRLAVAQTDQEVSIGGGLRLGSAVVHTRDLAAAKTFYHHVLGLQVRADSPGWVELDAGEASVALRPRSGHESGDDRALSFGFRIEDLMEWAEAARERGLHFDTVPRDEDWGVFADATDPDGNEVRFYQPAEEPAIEEELAEAFDDGVAPLQTSMRKPVKKASKAASRVAIKPAYKTKDSGARRRPSATTQKVASMRGEGLDRARRKPKRTADEKKAKVKPAQGRLRKAKDKVMKRKKRAVARASKAKPVKRATSKGSASRRPAAKRAIAKRGRSR